MSKYLVTGEPRRPYKSPFDSPEMVPNVPRPRPRWPVAAAAAAAVVALAAATPIFAELGGNEEADIRAAVAASAGAGKLAAAPASSPVQVALAKPAVLTPTAAAEPADTLLVADRLSAVRIAPTTTAPVPSPSVSGAAAADPSLAAAPLPEENARWAREVTQRNPTELPRSEGELALTAPDEANRALAAAEREIAGDPTMEASAVQPRDETVTGTVAAVGPAAASPAAEEPAETDQPSLGVSDETADDRVQPAEAKPALRTAKITTSVNMRAGPDNGAAVISVVPAGRSVEVIGCKFWCEIRFEGKNGFVFKSFVNGGKSASATKPTKKSASAAAPAAEKKRVKKQAAAKKPTPKTAAAKPAVKEPVAKKPAAKKLATVEGTAAATAAKPAPGAAAATATGQAQDGAWNCGLKRQCASYDPADRLPDGAGAPKPFVGAQPWR